MKRILSLVTVAGGLPLVVFATSHLGPQADAVTPLVDYYNLIVEVTERMRYVGVVAGMVFLVWGVVQYSKSRSVDKVAESVKKSARRKIIAGVIALAIGIIMPILVGTFSVYGNIGLVSP